MSDVIIAAIISSLIGGILGIVSTLIAVKMRLKRNSKTKISSEQQETKERKLLESVKPGTPRCQAPYALT